jgi:hypothetical protein
VSLNQTAETFRGRGHEGTLAVERSIYTICLADRYNHVAPEAAPEVLVLLAQPLLKLGG